ncbi:MAG: SDR family oxidoreductase [Acidobacteria bacterium]|nr:SDR family oxidoreductase [Acidobacteriota bacterium]
MDLGLHGKVAIVAGASRGLGKATALALAREGARVAICAREQDRLDSASNEIARIAGAEVLAVPCDVTSEVDVTGLIQVVLERWARINILVNNAGGPPAGLFDELTMTQWRSALELNLLSTVRLCRGVVPHMRHQQWGRIVNITSVSARQPVPGLMLSNAGRAGVLGFAKTLSNELAVDHITVNSVCPGYTRTDRLAELAQATAERESMDEDAVFRAWKEAIPMKRLGEPDELAALITFLCSIQAGYITGCAIPVDGGLIQSTF